MSEPAADHAVNGSGGRRALVTGGGSGLGRAMMARFARAGWRVLATDIDEDALAGVEAEFGRLGTVTTRRQDVQDDAGWLRARQWCEDTWGGLDVLVNNAGVASGGRMELIPMDDWDWIIELNLKSVVRGCRTFIPLFKRQGSGQIVNTASLAALANAPSMASYNVTKSAVLALSQTLRYELRPYGIGVSVLCPGFVKTNLGSSMRSPDPGSVEMAHKLIEGATVTADDVAEQVFAAIARDRFLVLTHREGRLLYTLKRLSPGLVERVMVRRWAAMRKTLEQPV